MATITQNEKAQVVDFAELKRIREELARTQRELEAVKAAKSTDVTVKLNASGGVYVRSSDASGNIPENLAIALLMPDAQGNPGPMLRAAMDYAGKIYSDADAYAEALNAALDKRQERESRKKAA